MEVALILLTLFVPSLTKNIPTLPHRYKALLNINIISEEFSQLYFSGAPGATLSVSEYIDVVAEKSAITFSMENFDKKTSIKELASVTKIKILWNPLIDGLEKYVIMTERKIPNSVYTCSTTESYSITNFERLLWGFDSKEPKLPTIQNLLNAGNENYVCSDDMTYMNQIRVFRCTKYLFFTSADGQLKFEGNSDYYWSDSQSWISTSGTGRSVPVYAMIRGKMNNVQNVALDISFINFNSVEVSEKHFNILPDMWCEGRKPGINLLPKLPKTFKYNAEHVIDWKGNDGPITYNEEVVYDSKLNVSKKNYRPFTITSQNTLSFSKHYMTEIKDFSSNLAYFIDEEKGNCQIKEILDTNYYFDDETQITDNQITIKNPLVYWHWDFIYHFNSITEERNLENYAYVAKSYLNSTPYTVAVNLFTIVHASKGQTEYLAPNTVQGYPSDDYNIKTERYRENIFGFRATEFADLNRFDITPCFEDKNMVHRVLRLGWNFKRNPKNFMKAIEDSVRTTLALSGGTSPIRIQKIMIHPEKSDSALYIIFTLVDFPPNVVETPVNIPESSFVSVSIILRNLEIALSDDSLIFKIPISESENLMLKADKTFFKDVKRIGDESSFLTLKGYSEASLGLLCFFMALIGLTGAFVLFKYVLKF